MTAKNRRPARRPHDCCLSVILRRSDTPGPSTRELQAACKVAVASHRSVCVDLFPFESGKMALRLLPCRHTFCVVLCDGHDARPSERLQLLPSGVQAKASRFAVHSPTSSDGGNGLTKTQESEGNAPQIAEAVVTDRSPVQDTPALLSPPGILAKVSQIDSLQLSCIRSRLVHALHNHGRLSSPQAAQAFVAIAHYILSRLSLSLKLPYRRWSLVR